MMAGEGMYACPRCGRTLPTTAEHWHFRRDGRVNGICKPCRSAANAAYDALHPWRYGPARRAYQRAWFRRRNGTPPERYRVQEASS